jgi:hypothetical protein
LKEDTDKSLPPPVARPFMQISGIVRPEACCLFVAARCGIVAPLHNCAGMSQTRVARCLGRFWGAENKETWQASTAVRPHLFGTIISLDQEWGASKREDALRGLLIIGTKNGSCRLRWFVRRAVVLLFTA